MENNKYGNIYHIENGIYKIATGGAIIAFNCAIGSAYETWFFAAGALYQGYKSLNAVKDVIDDLNYYTESGDSFNYASSSLGHAGAAGALVAAAVHNGEIVDIMNHYIAPISFVGGYSMVALGATEIYYGIYNTTSAHVEL